MGKCKTLIQRYPFMVFGLIILLIHCFLSTSGDDIGFAKEIADNPWAFAYKRYMQWSSRVFTDALLYWLTKLPVLWWRIADSLVITILARNIYRIIFKNNDNHVCIFLLGLFLFPLWEMSGAGWMATTVNYIWPFMSFSYIVLLIKESYDGSNIKGYQWILYILAILYTINFEQTVVLLVILPLYLIVEAILLKRPGNRLLNLTLLLGILGVGFNLTCPGNIRRIIPEINTWFPTFSMLSLPEKLTMGVSDTLFHLTKGPVLLYVVFLFCLFLYVHFKYHRNMYDFVNILPVLFVSVSTVLPIYRSGIPGMSGYYLIHAESLNHLVVFVLQVTADWLLFFWPLISMAMIFSKETFFRAAMVYLAGFGIRALMGLSPTNYASGPRTFLPVYLALLIIIFLLYKEAIET